LSTHWRKVFFESGLIVGVPDSLLSPFTSLIPLDANHITAVNEGAAVATAAGFSLLSGKVPLVYMQNSGLGNAINPLMSLAHKKVYACPMVLIVGWRGETDQVDDSQQDEPQHNSMGLITQGLLQLLGAEPQVCDENNPLSPELLVNAMELALLRQAPVALLVRRGAVFAPKTQPVLSESWHQAVPSRREFLEVVAELEDTFFIATTGHIAREMYAVCKSKGMSSHLFMVTGAMGHVVSIAQGFAISHPNIRFKVIDGDGSFLMHMGGITALKKSPNLSYVVLNNRGHASVGGQATADPSLNIREAIAGITGITAGLATTTDELRAFLVVSKSAVECITNFETSPELPRPRESHEAMAMEFKKAILEEKDA